MASAVASHSEDGKDSVGEHQNKVFLKIFQDHVPINFQQIVGKVCKLV